MAIELYNTLTRSKERFDPQGEVKLYTCGPTVYHFAHLGNLRTYIFDDVLRRALEADRYQVNHVMNITDVGHLTSDADEGEDKLEKGAAREGKTVWEVAQFYTDAFFTDLKRLNIEMPTTIVKATDAIDKQIEMIKLLKDKGFLYQTDLAVYFDTSKLSDYGKLTGQRIEDKKTERDVVQDPGKKHQADFAVWFFLAGHYKDHTMHWPSPWGEGFPGWHIECSAINWQEFPNGTDIHTGGIDHIPVHHTNEIAQYEAALDKPMSQFWMHGNFLVLSGKGEAESVKMAKSGDNFLTLQAVIDKGIDPLAYRYLCLQAHYRSELKFSWEALEAAQNALRSLQASVREWTNTPHDPCTGCIEQFMSAINDDLNTAGAVAALWELVKSDKNDAVKAATVIAFDKVLGLGLAELIGQAVAIPADVQQLVDDREQARKDKDFAQADRLRAQIAEAGFTVEDTAQGPKVTAS